MKKTIKWIIYFIIFVIILPFGFFSKSSYKLFRSSLLFDFFAQTFSLFPGLLGQIIRACYYKQTLKKSHLDLNIGFGSFVSKIQTSIGKGVLVTGHTSIGLATIGDNVVIANYVSILSGRYQHNFKDPNKNIQDYSDTFSLVRIGCNTFIGDKSVVMANIGENTIIGAGSIVVKEIPSYCLAVGNPAKVIKRRG